MKIGVFSPYLDTLGGGEKYMLTIASCLSAKHEIFVFWDDKEILNKASSKFNIDLSKVKIAKNIFNNNNSLSKKLVQSSKYNAIFYLSDGSIPLLNSKLYIHFQFPVEWVNSKGLINKLKIKRVKKFICNSEYTKKFIDKKFNVNSLVLYPPAEILSLQQDLSFKNKKNIILNVGRIQIDKKGNYFKKQDFLIQSFKKIFDKGIKDWIFTLVVSYKESDATALKRLKGLIKNYPVKIVENPKFLELMKIYKDAKIYWHASGFGEDLEKNPELAEHFGISTVEAMSAGCVPVVINAGGQKEIVIDGQNGLLWNSIEEFQLKTLELIKNNSLLNKLSEHGMESAKKFSKERFCQEINRLVSQ